MQSNLLLVSHVVERKGHGGLHKAPIKEERKRLKAKKKRENRSSLLILYCLKVFFSELCRGKAIVTCTNHQQKNTEESERLRGDRDQIKFIYLGFARSQVLGFRKARRSQDVP